MIQNIEKNEDGDEKKKEKEMGKDLEEENEDEYEEDDEYQYKMASNKIKEILTLESFDPRAKPFLIKQKKAINYLICFKLLTYCVLLNYKKWIF